MEASIRDCEEPGVSHVFFDGRLWLLISIESPRAQKGSKCIVVDIFDRGRPDHLLLGQYESEIVEELLAFSGRRRHAAAFTADPEAPVIVERLESARLKGHFYLLKFRGSFLWKNWM